MSVLKTTQSETWIIQAFSILAIELSRRRDEYYLEKKID